MNNTCSIKLQFDKCCILSIYNSLFQSLMKMGVWLWRKHTTTGIKFKDNFIYHNSLLWPCYMDSSRFENCQDIERRHMGSKHFNNVSFYFSKFKNDKLMTYMIYVHVITIYYFDSPVFNSYSSLFTVKHIITVWSQLTHFAVL